MGIYGYPRNRSAPGDADYVVTSLSPDLVNAKLLEPGIGIAITVIGNSVIVENTGGSGGAPSTASFITRNDETVNMPNSYRIIQGPGVGITYVGNTVTFTGLASDQSFITASTETSLPGDRALTVVAPLSAVDGGAGNNFTINLNGGQEYQALGTTSGSPTWIYGADLGLASHSGGGSVVLSASSESVHVFDATAGNYTVTLPGAATCLNKTFVFKKMDVTTNIITLQSADLIDGQVSASLVIPYQAYSIRSIGSTFIIH